MPGFPVHHQLSELIQTHVYHISDTIRPSHPLSCPSTVESRKYTNYVSAHHLASISTTLSVPWTARRSNQPILKEISPEYSLEGLMLKLKLQYFGHLMQRADSLGKTLELGKMEGRRRRGDRG